MTPSPTPRIWNPSCECLPRPELEALQLERLRALVRRAWDCMPYYAQKMREARIHPDDVRTREDLARLPFTTKDDLRRLYPLGAITVPMREVVRLHASTGTTGQATVVGYTRADLALWSEVVARFLVAGGLTPDDTVQLAMGYGMFTGGLGLHYGVEKVGAAVVPVSSGNTERQIQYLRDFGVTALVCTPTYGVQIGENLKKHGIDPKSLRLRWGFFGGEFWSESVRSKLQGLLPLRATDNYGLSEVIGPGVSGECLEQNGMHVSEDHFWMEILDRDTLQPVPDGQEGEIVLTTLTKEAVPVIRYRTRDISRLLPESCPCGRTGRRMVKVLGRTDDMLIIRGVNLFPSQIEQILLQFQHAQPHYLIIASRDGTMDSLELKVEVSPDLFSDEMRQMSALHEQMQTKLKSTLGVQMKVTLVEPGSLERFTGKAKRVLDLRTF